MTTPEIRDLAKTTLSTLRASIWVNHPPYPGQDCLITAMPFSRRRSQPLIDELTRRINLPPLASQYKYTVQYLADWNDDPNRTFAEVEALLLSVINDEEQET